MPKTAANKGVHRNVSTEHNRHPNPPIHELPNELLIKVFELTHWKPTESAHWKWEDEAHSYLTLRWSSRRAPFNLLQVCRLWRGLVQSTPLLWNNISGTTFKYDRPAPAEMGYWLKNSGTLPLRLELDCSNCRNPTENIRQLNILDLYGTYSHRWESLCLKLTGQMTEKLTSILLADSDAFSSLSRLEISFDFSSRPRPLSQSVEELSRAFASAKSLRKLYWRYFAPFSGHLHFPWHQLEVVYIDTIQPVEKVDLYMSQCLIATDITFIMFTGNSEDGPQPPSSFRTSYLPHLISLNWEAARTYRNPLALLKSLVAPNLKRLRVSACSGDIDRYDDLEAFLDGKSQCALEEITVDDTTNEEFMAPLIADKLFRILARRSIPSVQIYRFYMHSVLFCALKENPQNQPFPGFLAWMDRRNRAAAIGWKELDEEEETRLFSWKDGELTVYADEEDIFSIH